MLASTVLLSSLFFLQNSVYAQISYVTIYGQLTQFQCPVGPASGPCTGWEINTNGTAPGIPPSPMLDFSQSVIAGPAQSDAGKQIQATGYYGQEPSCTIADGCPAFFVHIWAPHYGQLNPPPGVGCWTSSNSGQTWVSVACVTAPNIPLGPAGAIMTQANFGQLGAFVIAIVLVAALFYFGRHRK